MNYEERWKVLADLLTELRKNGEELPAKVMNDLRSTKTMMQILKDYPNHIENVPKVEAYLGNVESYLISAAQKKFGSDYVEIWMRKLEEAGRMIKVEEKAKATLRFVPGVPRDKHWVRIRISENTSRKDVERLAEGERLSHKMQKKGYMLVWGDGENIKTFVKKMAEKSDLVRRL